MAPGSKPQAFLDSNVIFSGLYSPKGAPGQILELFVKGDISIVMSPQVLDEVIGVVREKIPAALPALRRLLLNSPPEITADPHPEDISRWQQKLSMGDAAILVAAIAAQPDYFITGDKHFLANSDIGAEAGLQIITPAQFLKLRKQ